MLMCAAVVHMVQACAAAARHGTSWVPSPAICLEPCHCLHACSDQLDAEQLGLHMHVCRQQYVHIRMQHGCCHDDNSLLLCQPTPAAACGVAPRTVIAALSECRLSSACSCLLAAAR
jgi:hypothetical protein